MVDVVALKQRVHDTLFQWLVTEMTSRNMLRVVAGVRRPVKQDFDVVKAGEAGLLIKALLKGHHTAIAAIRNDLLLVSSSASSIDVRRSAYLLENKIYETFSGAHSMPDQSFPIVGSVYDLPKRLAVFQLYDALVMFIDM